MPKKSASHIGEITADHFKSTSEGRLYIETEDFFRIPKVQEMIKGMMNSSVFKEIEKYHASKLNAADSK